MQLEQACFGVVVEMVEDVLGLAFALVGQQLHRLVSRNLYGLGILAALLVCSDHEAIFVEFDTDQHVYFIDFPYPGQLEIILRVYFPAIKAAPVRLLPRNSPPPLPFRRVPQHKGKVGNILNDFLLLLPVLLELACIIARFLLLQPLQQPEVLAIDGLRLFLAEGIIQAFVHPLVLKILALPLADRVGYSL